MPEKKETPSVESRVDRILQSYSQAEQKLSQFSKRKLIILLIALAVGFAALGVLIGVVFSPYRASETPATTTSSGASEIVSYSGVVRQSLGDGSTFYLEKDDGAQVLLKSSKIDFTFFSDSQVTAEGVVVRDAQDGNEILFVNKLRIK